MVTFHLFSPRALLTPCITVTTSIWAFIRTPFLSPSLYLEEKGQWHNYLTSNTKYSIYSKSKKIALEIKYSEEAIVADRGILEALRWLSSCRLIKHRLSNILWSIFFFSCNRYCLHIVPSHISLTLLYYFNDHTTLWSVQWSAEIELILLYNTGFSYGTIWKFLIAKGHYERRHIILI